MIQGSVRWTTVSVTGPRALEIRSDATPIWTIAPSPSARNRIRSADPSVASQSKGPMVLMPESLNILKPGTQAEPRELLI
jgi:hypothetical protein